MRLTREGVWVRGPRGGEALRRWRALAPLLLTPPLLALLLVSAVNRGSLEVRVLLRRPDAEAARKVLAQVRVGLDNALRLAPVGDDSPLPTVDLRVNRGALELMERSVHQGDPRLDHAPGGTKPYLPGIYRDEEGALQRCEVAYRGREPLHHLPTKPSFRVRLKRRHLLQGRRFIELQRPEDALAVKNLLPEALARELGLLANVSQPVRLFVNRKYFGVYLRTHRPEERLALVQGRLPGVFFKGDAEAGDAALALWRTSQAWLVEGEADDVARARHVLDRLLSIVDPGARRPVTPADLLQVERLLDEERWATWSALMAVVGGVHTDFGHNQLLFWGSTRGRLEPVVWDANAFGMLARPRLSPDVVLHPITEWLSCDPRWVHRRNLLVRDLLDGPCSPAALEARLDAHLARARRDLAADPNLTDYYAPRAASDLDAARDETAAWIEARAAFLREYLAYARVHAAPDPARAGWTRVQVSGAAALRVHGVGPAPLLLYPGLTADLYVNDQALGPNPKAYAAPAPMTYALPAAAAALRFENAVTGAPVTPSADPVPELPLRTLAPLALPGPPDTAPVALGPGEVTLERDLTTAPGQPLLLRAGTTLRLGPGVSIVARGPVRAEGTAALPVVLGPLDPARPWGCLAVVGPATAGTRLSHLQAAGGGEGTDGLARFAGMVSVYGCPDVELTGCRLGAYASGDAALHLAESHARLVGLTVEGAPRDALDLDLVTGSLEGCTVIGAGDDGLDLALSRVVVRGGAVRGCGDEGISVAAASRVVVRGARVEGCRYGARLEDGAAALLEGCTLLGNAVGLHARKRRWVFRAPGTGALVGTRVEASGVADATLEDGARVWLVGSTLERPGHGAGGLVRADAVPEPLATWFRELE